MLILVRLAVLAAAFALTSVPAFSADKAFQRGELADSAIKLEAQIKSEAHGVSKPAATLQREADAAFERRDARTGMQLLSQLAATAPNDSGNWLRLARAILRIAPTNDAERSGLLERAASAAFIAYERAKDTQEQAESLLLLGRTFADRKLWRPALDALRASLELRELAEVRGLYERLRDEHGFRILDYSVDSDAASPRVCFQFSEALAGKRTDFSPFVAVAGQQSPALSTDDKQLCIEGLRHGESYAITLRAGLPSGVHEALSRSAQFNIYVKDRAPFVHFAGNAYVLPRSGQRGIPLVSVNTKEVAIEIYRVGDRNLIDTVLGHEFRHNLDRYDVERLGRQQGARVWTGELNVESKLNTDVTTAFPVDQAIGTRQPGVYVMVAQPKGPPEEGALATQWFIISDLGLTAYSAADGITAFVHSLATTEPKADASVRLIARNNELLATRNADAAGVVHFEPGLSRGEGGLAPAMLIAEQAGDYAFLNLKTPAFDLSDRGVSGRLAPAGLDAFVYTERGVYRSGETVNITALLRDAQGAAVLGVPLSIVVERPDGVEYRRAVVSDQGLGGRSLRVPIVKAAPTGTWQVRVFSDPRAASIGRTSFMVEDYVPDRLEFELSSDAALIAPTKPLGVSVSGHYLYGAPASALPLEAELTVVPARERPGFAGYQFGLDDEDVSPERETLAGLAETDAQGNAHFLAAIKELPTTSRPLEARLAVSMSDPGGRPVQRNLTLPVRPSGDMIGVKPLFAGSALQQGEPAAFDIIVAAPDGNRVTAARLQWQLLKIETRYQWYRQDGEWQFAPVKTMSRVAAGDVEVPADKPAHLAMPVSWGRYRFEVANEDPDGPVTSVVFDVGFYAEAAADSPDVLEVALDQSEYRAGDTMALAIRAPSAGKLTVAVIGERLLATRVVDVGPGLAHLDMTVGEDWGTGAYIVATLRRPLDVEANHMPSRAIGVRWFAIDRAAHTLALELNLPSLARGGQALPVTVKALGLAPGEEVRVVLAAVDVGILNLTNYKPPAPEAYFLGQRRLSAEIRDLYGQLIDGMQAGAGEIRNGGDVGAGELSGSPPTQPPLALYSGILSIGSAGTAEMSFALPDFTGTVRVMATAWSKYKTGHAVADVVLRDPVVLATTLPRFLRLADRGTIRLDLDNLEGPAGDYRLELTAEGGVALAEPAARTVKLAAKQHAAVSATVTAAALGAGRLAVRLTGPEGFALSRQYPLTIKSPSQSLSRQTVKELAQGESLTLSADLFADLLPGSGSVAVSIGGSRALDVAFLLNGLEQNPFGCSEQIASRALPLLYINELASQPPAAPEETIAEAIDRLLARQGSNGSFGLWSAGGEDIWLDAYITDFLTRARERGFKVADTAFKLALERLRNAVALANDPAKQGGDLAYVLYVLAKNRLAPIGDLRYLADAKLGDLKTPMARAQIAAALEMVGDRARADRMYAAALENAAPDPGFDIARSDFGSPLRDAAAMVVLASEAGQPRTALLEAVERVEAARARTRATSTQEDAWLILAARALAQQQASVTIEVAGVRQQAPFYRSFATAELKSAVKITNTAAAPLQAVMSVSGVPLLPEPAREQGLKIERLFYSPDGTPADPAKAKQNQRFVVVLRITEVQPRFGRLMATDALPAGFEIDNPHLLSTGQADNFSWIKDAVEPISAEFRDERFSAAFTRSAEDRPVFTVAYVVRAVSPGRYLLPQAYVEDMYRPDRFGRTSTGTVEVSALR